MAERAAVPPESHLKPIWVFAVLSLLAVACPGGSAAGAEEICSNGVDDNGDGSADCADSQCASDARCQSSADAGTACSAQADCLAVSYIYDDPLPACVASHCRANAKGIDLRFEVDISAAAGATQIGSLNTRFVLRRAVDGSAVTCDSLRAMAAGKTADKAGQIEGSRKVNLLAFDVVRVSSSPGSTLVVQPFLNTGVGSDYLIWTELWTGVPDSDTRLPTGTRLGFGCVDSASGTPELKPEDDWPASGATATSRTLRARITQLD